ncbi:breast cancer anti-estrogen resistance protein 3 homolog [Pectinophora gossypiella]|uniref:breast cancer anti-estrogen resistance protein 3 homolog n=1 Tax=Pectinophora gossypiella TaxID=13191 RepID=UPI00214E08F0|nr:breast cancer anti-estrogen resistance protein 3 homolog [Pectinophora gossypiella]
MDTSSMSTSGLLEWEFSLPSDQIISHGWYHGALSRTAAENLLQQDREFLVRDSSSQPDNYVLSCRSNGQHLHFVIQRIVVHPETVYERYQYQFEDEAYDTVADLITSYVGSGKPISAASGARIQYPANRVVPLTNYLPTDDVNSVVSPVGDGSGYGNPYSLYSHFAAKPGLQMRVPFKKQRSHSLTPIDMSQHNNHAKSASADGVIQGQNNKHGKNFSGDSNSSGTWEANLPTSPPAKPARYDGPKADDRRLELQRLYHVSGSDSGNGSGDSTQSSAHSDPNKSRLESEYHIVTPTIRQQFDYDLTEARLLQAENLDYSVESRINLEKFQSQIISSGLSKPLESETLHTIKLLLRTSGPRILANHLTKVDLHFLLEDAPQIEGIEKTASGLELCFLPQGRSLRLDVIERIETFRLLIAVTILTCQTDRQRADTINDWILLAVETKTALGNLYGFSAIMFGLCMPQVECLENAWNILRRVYTDNAFMFEAKLRPCFKSMNEGTNPLPPNTTTPYVLPPVLCFHLFDGDGGGLMQPDDTFPGSLFNSLDFDFNATAAHLEAARHFPEQVDMFKRNARTVVQEMSSLGPTLDPTLLELFRTEFHINFLWGERGALTTPNQRFARLTDILTAMANKLAVQPLEDQEVV